MVTGLPLSAPAAEFSVSPIRIEFDRANRMAAVTVRNDGTDRLEAQVTLSEWSQDAAGKDVYQDSKDLVFFPRMLTVEAGQEAIVRIGIRTLPPSVERTYRLYIAEIPPAQKEGGARVNVRVRFGIGVFVRPPVESYRAEFAGLAVENGTIRIPVRNTGTSSFKVEKLLVRGDRPAAEPLWKELDGWYVLAGATRTFQIALTPEDCRGLTRVEVEAKADKMTLKGGLDLDAAACAK